MSNQSQPTPANRQLVLAIALIILGTLFLLNNFNLLYRVVPRIMFSWEAVLGYIGVFLLLTNHRLPGFILIALSLIFLLPDVFQYSFYAMRRWWPVVLIGGGVFLLYKYQIAGKR